MYGPRQNLDLRDGTCIRDRDPSVPTLWSSQVEGDNGIRTRSKL